MAAFTFKITRNDISPALSRMARTARNPQEVLRAMGTTFQSITMGNFKIDPSYRPRPWPAKKKDGQPSFLMLHNVLSRSFHLDVTDKYAKVGTPVIYGARHQFGYPEGGTPARPYFPVDESGRLTAKAKEKIKAAGERVIVREANGE
jgi:phage gpG-like protein